MMSIAGTKQWQALAAHQRDVSQTRIDAYFAQDPGRPSQFSLTIDGILIDYSKNFVRDDTLALLFDLARQARLSEWIERMFAGEPINNTEGRAVLHTALRNQSARPVFAGGKDVMPDVRRVLSQMAEFVGSVHAGRLRGATGQKLTRIVNIGIGGSDLGPNMVSEALRHLWQPGMEARFVSNIDGGHLSTALQDADPQTTLFVIASKTFTTLETMTNARDARAWLVKHLGEAAVKHHFVAVSTNEAAVRSFGIDPNNMFVFWDWVGGRYSLWSAIGLPVALLIGMDRFMDLLKGAHAMDEHFRTAPMASNGPVILGLLGVWYHNFFQFPSHAIIPYLQALHRFSAHFQQVDMESNGKRVTRDGVAVDYMTGPVIWGEPGTNSQHAFFQLLHQGTQSISIDFIAAAQSPYPLPDHHDLLIANCIAQSAALMTGKTEVQVLSELKQAGFTGDDARKLAPHKVFPGNRPSTTIMLPRLNPYYLGMLTALYEHKIFVQGVIWNINSFDQWGVELGKELAAKISRTLTSQDAADVDPSTALLIDYYRKHRTQT